ncbi:GntR family transcriptional regulator [Nocardia gipuzkoensis]
MANKTARRVSTPSVIAAHLRNELIEGTLAAGSRMTEEALCARFSAGRHSVRAAIQILTSEGLLVHERNKGAVVPMITDERIDEMCSYRSVLELGALRMALQRGADWSAVEAAVRALEIMSDDAPWREIIEAHAAIHRAITNEGRNARVTEAHDASEAELEFMLAIIKPDYSASRLAAMHRHLLEQLRLGGEAALRALEEDLELGGRAAMHLALRRSRESSMRGSHAVVDEETPTLPRIAPLRD